MIAVSLCKDQRRPHCCAFFSAHSCPQRRPASEYSHLTTHSRANSSTACERVRFCAQQHRCRCSFRSCATDSSDFGRAVGVGGGGSAHCFARWREYVSLAMSAGCRDSWHIRLFYSGAGCLVCDLSHNQRWYPEILRALVVYIELVAHTRTHADACVHARFICASVVADRERCECA